MEQGNKRWIIRNAAGQIDGPFTTEKVLYKIGRGEFSGEESIAHYPDGKWIAISQDPQFYDKLLEVLSQNEPAEGHEETRVLEFTRPQPTQIEPTPTTPPGEATTQDHDIPAEVVPIEKSRRKRRKKLDDIELVDTRMAVWVGILKRAKMPVVLVLGGVALASVLYVTTAPN